jgi:hypothetical protein
MPGPDEKSFAIPRPMVWEAWRRRMSRSPWNFVTAIL